MSRALSRVLCVVLLALAGVAGAAAWLQREAAAGLSRELALLREETQQLAALRAENDQLKANRTPEAEVSRLRADRSALLRLRNEVEQLRERVDQRAKRVE